MVLRLYFLNFFTLAFLTYQTYIFYTDPSSDLGVLKKAAIDAEEVIKTRKKSIATLEEFKLTLGDKKKIIKEYVRQIESLGGDFTEEQDAPQFIKTILSEAKSVGLNIDGISPQKEQKHDFYIEHLYELQFKGVFAQVIAFLDKTNKLKSLVLIPSMGLKSTGFSAGPFAEIKGVMQLNSLEYISQTKQDNEAKAKADKQLGEDKKPEVRT